MQFVLDVSMVLHAVGEYGETVCVGIHDGMVAVIEFLTQFVKLKMQLVWHSRNLSKWHYRQPKHS